ncbi:MAG: hypothetical protein RL173_1995 [Fibrobacterota bacterium]
MCRFPGVFQVPLFRRVLPVAVLLATCSVSAQIDPADIQPDSLPALAGSAEFSDADAPSEIPAEPSRENPVALERPSALPERVQKQARAERRKASNTSKEAKTAAKSGKPDKKRRTGPRPGVVDIPAGCFRMGSPDELGPENEHPRHQVCLDAFRMDRLPVLESEFEAQTGEAPWTLCEGPACSVPNPDHPAWYVTWREADTFCRAKGGRLPTEAEFEYAARAGDSGAYVWGDTLKQACDHANLADLSLAQTMPGWSIFPCNDGHALIATAGGRKPNRFGLYDMAGNVWQWASDWYAADWYSRSPESNPRGPADGTGRVMRGGSWLNGPTGGRVAYRDGFNPEERYSGAIGFRCVYPSKSVAAPSP